MYKSDYAYLTCISSSICQLKSAAAFTKNSKSGGSQPAVFSKVPKEEEKLTYTQHITRDRCKKESFLMDKKPRVESLALIHIFLSAGNISSR